MITRSMTKVGRVVLYYATCDQCHAWITSSIGQFVWSYRNNRDRNADRHKEMHHGSR